LPDEPESQFFPDLPDDFVIYEAEIEVPGVRHRQREALAFARGRDHSLALEGQPAGRPKPSTIKVIGVSTGWFFTRRRFLGYVPHDSAVRIVEKGFWGKVRPRVRNIWVSRESEYVIIRLDLIGPTEGTQRYVGVRQEPKASGTWREPGYPPPIGVRWPTMPWT
jgi:hypothetical protein